MTVRLEEEVKDRLDLLAASTQRSKSFLAAEAIKEFVENNEWQIAELRWPKLMPVTLLMTRTSLPWPRSGR